MKKSGNTHNHNHEFNLQIQTRYIEPGKLYASVTRTESKQPNTNPKNQEIQEKNNNSKPGTTSNKCYMGTIK